MVKTTYVDNYLLYSYLKNDSMYVSYNFLTWNNIPCLKGSNPKLILNFADDTLYAITIKLEYTPEEFNALEIDYNMLVNSLKKKYTKFEKKVFSSQATGEQVGESYSFEPHKGLKNKTEEYAIGFEYWGNTRNANKFSKDNYTLTIEYVNTKHTKFNKREVFRR